jgi:cardiolipin synthase A/B
LTYQLFTDVKTYYTKLVESLEQAQSSITMMYFTFDYGEWANKISSIMQVKAQNGLKVRLMVDEVGMIVDSPENIIKNKLLMDQIRDSKIELILFRPKQKRTTNFNRLHFKLCSIDDKMLFVGGSNIGDEYLKMNDLNLVIEGAIGNDIDNLYDFINTNNDSNLKQANKLHISSLKVGENQIVLTLPGSRNDVRRALLDLILDAEKSLYIRTWYFLPDKEIMNALLHQCEQGCKVNVLFSDKTRIPMIDAANYIVSEQLFNVGAKIWRFTPHFMHAKASWNDKGEVLFGSANLDSKALKSNYECSILFQDANLVKQLISYFNDDLKQSKEVTKDSFKDRNLLQKSFAQLSLRVSEWL